METQVYEFDGNIWEAEEGEKFERLLVEYESIEGEDELDREILETDGMWEYIGGYHDVEEEVREKAKSAESSEEDEYYVIYNANNFQPRFFQKVND